MSDDKQPMQVSGEGTRGDAPVAPGKDAHGESGGGAYPNPHSGKDAGGFDGGQTGKAYHGGGQLGNDVVSKNSNAPTRRE